MTNADRSPIIASVPPELLEIAPAYLTAVRQALKDIRAGLQRGDFDFVRNKAHQMKGEGSSYGFVDISTVGREMQMAAESRDAENILAGVERLDDYLDRVSINAGR